MKRRTVFLLILLLFFINTICSPGQVIKTPAEENGYSQYTQYWELTNYLTALQAESQNIVIKTIGRTAEGQDINQLRDIYLVIISEKGISSPDEADADKPTIYFLASQHGDEQSGKEAALVLIRELGMGKLKPLLSKVNVLIIPQMNPYGNEVDKRLNEQNLDLNRDHIKLEAPPVEAAHTVFRHWLPEVTMDLHEKGLNYYQIDIGVVSNINIDKKLQDYSRKKILPYIEKELERGKFTLHEYLVRQPIGMDTSSGAALSQQRDEREYLTRYSTTDINDGRNSFGIYNTLSFICEKSSDGTVNSLKQRTDCQLIAMQGIIEYVAKNAAEVKDLVKSCREDLAQKGVEYSTNDVVHVRMEYVEDNSEPPLMLKRFKGEEESIIGELKVDKKKGELVKASELDLSRRGVSREIESVQVVNWRPTVKSLLTVSRPLAYYIPQKHKDVVNTLLRHGIQVQQITADQPLEIQCYKIKEIVPSQSDYLAPGKIEVQSMEQEIIAKKGDFLISCHQLASNQIVIFLEPQSSYGLIRYCKYNLVPQAGDIFSIYRILKKNNLKTISYKKWSISF
jgi:hypothetical protein